MRNNRWKAFQRQGWKQCREKNAEGYHESQKFIESDFELQLEIKRLELEERREQREDAERQRQEAERQREYAWGEAEKQRQFETEEKEREFQRQKS